MMASKRFIYLPEAERISVKEGLDAAQAGGLDGDLLERPTPRPLQEIPHDLGAVAVVLDVLEGAGEEDDLVRPAVRFFPPGPDYGAVMALAAGVLPPGRTAGRSRLELVREVPVVAPIDGISIPLEDGAPGFAQNDGPPIRGPPESSIDGSCDLCYIQAR